MTKKNSAEIEQNFQEALQEFKSNKIYLFDKTIDLDGINNFATAIKKKYNQFIIIGFGASTLNLKALLSCIEKHNIWFIDNTDRAEIEHILNITKHHNTAIFTISLSGETDEVIKIIKYIQPEPNNLFIIAKKNSTLHALANQSQANYIEYPAGYNIGRCALFNPVFLNIAAIAEVNVRNLYQKATKALNSIEIHKEVISDTTWLLENYHQNRRNVIFISYIPSFQGLLLWINQLIAESLGKSNFGLTPQAFWGTRYEHSILQLFLAGPDDKIYHVFLNPNIQNSIDQLMHNHGQAVVQKLQEYNRPIQSNYVKDIDETIVAKLIVKYILIVGLIGKIQQFNPFNQPEVEDLKLLIKK